MLRLEEESKENMNMKRFPLFLAVAVLLAVGGQVVARHVTHPVTPANISKQPFSFTVTVKAVGEVQEFEVIVKAKAGGPAPVLSATGEVDIARSGKKESTIPTVHRVQSNGVQTYTFRLSPSDLDRARFTFTETPQDVRTPFPSPGDYWVFDLSQFAGNSRK
jgi:hypothetical protein